LEKVHHPGGVAYIDTRVDSVSVRETVEGLKDQIQEKKSRVNPGNSVVGVNIFRYAGSGKGFRWERVRG